MTAQTLQVIGFGAWFVGLAATLVFESWVALGAAGAALLVAITGLVWEAATTREGWRGRTR